MPSTKPCTIEGCVRTRNTAGLCAMHHYRKNKSGTAYNVQKSCLNCTRHVDTRLNFCSGCMSTLSVEDRKRIYKKHWFQKNKDQIKKTRKKPSKIASKFYNLKYNYGITLEEYEVLYNRTNGRCYICSKSPELKECGNRNWLCLDHDHDTNEIRGLLCGQCNSALGLFYDNTEYLARAMSYINEKGNVQWSDS